MLHLLPFLDLALIPAVSTAIEAAGVISRTTLMEQEDKFYTAIEESKCELFGEDCAIADTAMLKDGLRAHRMQVYGGLL
ncbi:hypothetical protein NVIE_019230 [Nitrososphaera viennensis EN76]|uniref:Uncharacterized protein n=1 Tax=Nitrososphaera viennensis EN76 TaxID=926571 RepID=A0A060HRM0_9ARCH|nr:hypothetical protein NVIE_019230 [Nitrososphaera viennensis EN76]